MSTMTVLPESIQHFPGLCGLLPSVSASSLEMDDITEDVTAEQETLVDAPLQPVLSKPTDSTIDFAKLQSTLMDASKGVTEGTDSEYRRLMFVFSLALMITEGVLLLMAD
ncbi:hypothetical protein F4604DRAFT_1933212 [Suillus subluteus]|nr:hypothetical protein F4604DRAFT_1933212 [Suillus subluteus]